MSIATVPSRPIMMTPVPAAATPTMAALMTRARWIEVGRIIGVGVIVTL